MFVLFCLFALMAHTRKKKYEIILKKKKSNVKVGRFVHYFYYDLIKHVLNPDAVL